MTKVFEMFHICRGPAHMKGLTPEQREIVAREQKHDLMSAAMLASAFLERNQMVEPPICTRPDCLDGILEVMDEDGHTWVEPCPSCRANEKWYREMGGSLR